MKPRDKTLITLVLCVITLLILAVCIRGRGQVAQYSKLVLDPYEGPVRKDGSIFVSIASYRDRLCNFTLRDMYENAARPDLLYAGIVQQNHIAEDEPAGRDCLQNFCEANDLCDHVKIIRMNHIDARGPTYARALASCLYEGQTWFFQIDSHTKFTKDWDEKLRNMILRLPEDKRPDAILSHYPQPGDFENDGKPEEKRKHTVPQNCGAKLDRKGMVQFIARERAPSRVPIRTFGNAGGFLFMPGRALIETPYDYELAFLFQGEEILYAARLWTRGYEFYVPTENVVYHFYSRKEEPKFWFDLKHIKKPQDPQMIVRKKLGFYGKKAEIGRFGLGTERTIDEYFENLGVDRKTMKVFRNTCDDK